LKKKQKLSLPPPPYGASCPTRARHQIQKFRFFFSKTNRSLFSRRARCASSACAIVAFTRQACSLRLQPVPASSMPSLQIHLIG
jgi:hypothetical protein